MAEKKWSQMTSAELLDAAQEKFNAYETGSGPFSITPPDLTMAGLLLQAAQVQATNDLDWTLQNRIVPTIANGVQR